MNGLREKDSLREGELANCVALLPASYVIRLPPLRVVSDLTRCLRRDEINTLAPALAHLQAYVLNRQVVVEWVRDNVDVGNSVSIDSLTYDVIKEDKSILKVLPKYFAASPLPVARNGRVSFKFHRALRHSKFDESYMYGYLIR